MSPVADRRRCVPSRRSARPAQPRRDATLCRVSDRLEQLLVAQSGVISTGQLAALGLRETGRWRVVDAQWRIAAPHVLVAHNGPLTRLQQLWVAQLGAPPGSAISGCAALELAGLRWSNDDVVDVTIRAGQRRPQLRGVRVHRSRDLGADVVEPQATPRRTRVARSAVDAAIWAATDSRARALLLAVVQQRLCRPDHIAGAVARRGPCRRRALIAETVIDAQGGVQSLPERQFALLVRRAGFPEPVRQRVVRRRDGRCFLDADWREYGFCVEVHGSQHFEAVQWDRDLARQNAVAATGRRVLQFTSFAVRHDPDTVRTAVERALRTGGWDGRRPRRRAA